MQSFSNEQSPNNLNDFYHNAPTRDIRLFMQLSRMNNHQMVI
ncbi:hypothetical protein OROHE_020824 [Orobanche hederae]